jgi:hypothetical protein
MICSRRLLVAHVRTPLADLKHRVRSRTATQIAFPVLALIISACAGPSTDHPAPQPTPARTAHASIPVDRFVGVWEGVYYAHPYPMGVTITLAAAGETKVDGDVRFYPLRELEEDARQRASRRSRGIPDPARGSYTVTGSYDPALRTFRLTPRAWIEQPPHTQHATVFAGVFDHGRSALAGTFTDRQRNLRFFALTRPDRARQLSEPMLGRPTAGPRSLRAPDDATLVRWASRLLEEHPELDPRRLLAGHYYVNLFDDAHFAAHFGATFDELPVRTRNAVHERFRHTARISTRRPGTLGALLERRPDEALREFRALATGFSDSGTGSAVEMLPIVFAQRTMRAWQADQRARVDAMPPTRETSADLTRLAAAGEEQLTTLWPSEKASFQAAIRDTGQRLAEPTMIAIVESLIEAEPSDEAALALAAWDRGPGLPVAKLRDDARAALQLRTQARLDEILPLLMAEERAKLDRIDSGPAAVSAGNRWLRSLQSRYAFAARHSAVVDTVALLPPRRAGDLAAAQPSLTDQINRFATAQEVRSFLNTTLAVPGDRDTAAGQALQQTGNHRIRAIDRAAYLAQFTPNEQRMLGNADRIDVVRHANVVPNRTDVHRAILRSFISAGGQWVDGDTVTYGLSLFQTQGPFVFHVQLDVGELAVRHIGPGPRWEFVSDVHFRLMESPEMERFFGDSIQGQILRGLWALTAVYPGTLSGHAIELTPDGWQSQTLSTELAARNLSILRPVFDAIYR